MQVSTSSSPFVRELDGNGQWQTLDIWFVSSMQGVASKVPRCCFNRELDGNEGGRLIILEDLIQLVPSLLGASVQNNSQSQ